MRFWGGDFEDVSQVMIGAAMLSVPIAFTEEAWDLSREIPLVNLGFLVILSLGFCALYAFQSIYRGKIERRRKVFLSRVFFDYLLSVLVVILVLAGLDRLPLLEDPMLSLRRIILIAFPATMGAVVTDGIDKE